MDLDEDPCIGIEKEYLESIYDTWKKTTTFCYKFYGGGIRPTNHFSVELDYAARDRVLWVIQDAIQVVDKDTTRLDEEMGKIEEAVSKEKETRRRTHDVLRFLSHFRVELLRRHTHDHQLNPHGSLVLMVLNEAKQRCTAAQHVEIDDICTLLNELTGRRLLGSNPFDLARLYLDVDLDLYIEKYPVRSCKERAAIITHLSSQLRDAGYDCHSSVGSLFPEGIPPWHMRLATKAIRRLKSTGDLFQRSREDPSPSNAGQGPLAESDADSYYTLIGSGWTAYRCRRLWGEI